MIGNLLPSIDLGILFISTCWIFCSIAIYIKRLIFDPVDWSKYPETKKIIDDTDKLINKIKLERKTRVPEDIQ